MSFHGERNAGRVRDIVGKLDLIRRSAESSRAGPDDVREMLRPVIGALKTLMTDASAGRAAVDGRDATAKGRYADDRRPPAWATVHDMAREATLPDLTRAMAVFLSRVDEELHSVRDNTSQNHPTEGD